MRGELVSVVIPCFKHAFFLPDALNSILNQTHQNWECIIVNDGSPDNTEIVANTWCKKDSRFKYLYKDNGGLSSARNFGIKKAIGKYILTLDADDKYEVTFIEKALLVLQSNENIGIVSSWLFRFDKNNIKELHKPNGGIINDFLFSNSAIGTSLFRKECWEKAGGYDEKMKLGYEDWEFYIRACKLGYSVHIIQEPLFYYRQHGVSMRTVAVNEHDIAIKFYIFEKHKELYIANFDKTILHFLNEIERFKNGEKKQQKKIDFRIGFNLLKPLRFIKKMFQ